MPGRFQFFEVKPLTAYALQQRVIGFRLDVWFAEKHPKILAFWLTYGNESLAEVKVGRLEAAMAARTIEHAIGRCDSRESAVA